MPLPKSVVKINNKDGVTFISNVDRVNYTIRELSRRALIDVGRFIKYECTKKINERPSVEKLKGKRKAESRATRNGPLGGGKRTRFRQVYHYWVRPKETDLKVGLHNTKYTNKMTWFGGLAELGLDGHPEKRFLSNTVFENIDTIRDIEARYLSAIEDERKALALIEEKEEIGDGEDEA